MATYADVPNETVNLQPQGASGPPSGMRKLEVNTAYGRHTVYIPITMSPDEALMAVRQQLLPKLEGAHQERLDAAIPENVKAADTKIYLPLAGGMVTIPGKYVIAAGEGFNSLIQGTKQLLGMGNASQDQKEAAAKEQMDRFYKLYPEAKVGQAVGVGAPLAAVSAAVTPAAALATPVASAVNALVQGGAMSGVPYVPPGGSRTANMVEGAKNALLMQAPFSALQKVAAGPANLLTPPQQAAVADMQNIPGVRPLPSQLTNNPALASIEKVGAYFPFSGGQIAARTAGNREAVTDQILKIMGAPEGSSYGTPDVLKAIKDSSTSVMNAVRDSGVPVQLSRAHTAALDAIREASLRTNSPNPKLIGTINKVIGDGSSELRPEIAALGPQAQEQAIASLGKAAFMPAKTEPKFEGGLPQDFFQSVQSDLSELSSKGQHLAGKANAILTTAAADSLPGTLGTDLINARQQYGALETAKGAFDPATGVVDPRKLTTSLSGGEGSGPDVARFLDSSNPRLVELAKAANAARGMPPVPAQGSDTAQKLAWQHWLGTLGELGAAGAAGVAGHMVSGGDIATTGAAGLIPFLFANYGTKAYLSPAFARYVQEGLPTMGELMRSGAPAGGAAIPGLAAALSTQ